MDADMGAIMKRLADVHLPENWDESPYREGDILIAGRGCIYPGSQMDGWCYYHDKMYFKPLTPEAEEELKAKGYERVHVTGKNGQRLLASEPASIAIGDLSLDLVFVKRHGSGNEVFAEDKANGYRLSASQKSTHASRWWHLTSKQHGGTAAVGDFRVSPPDIVKKIYAALPTHLRELPPDQLCFVCGEDTGGKCRRCGRPICQEHTAWCGDHQYDCWECSEKYCEPCWETHGGVESAEGAAAETRQAWLDSGKRAGTKGAGLDEG